MKKSLIVFGIALLGSITMLSAQSFGLKGGLNMGTLSGDDADDELSALVSFHVGAYASFDLGDKLKLQPEVVYSGEGAKDDDFDYKLTYINIPVMFKYYVAEGFNVHAGPQIGILTKAEITDGDASVDIKDDFESTSIGAGFGLGYDLDKINFSARYNLGLVSILKNEDSDLKNNAIQISVGYTF